MSRRSLPVILDQKVEGGRLPVVRLGIMRPWIAIIGTAALLASCGGAPTGGNASSSAPLPSSAMELTSPAFADGSALPASFTCDGPGLPPPLAIRGVPEGAASLALIVNDPDAPSGDFVHWTAWNITAQDQEIGTGSLPVGVREGRNSMGEQGYVSPCPPSGAHRYVFTLYALDAAPDLTTDATADDLRRAMEGHVVAEATLVGVYERS